MAHIPSKLIRLEPVPAMAPTVTPAYPSVDFPSILKQPKDVSEFHAVVLQTLPSNALDTVESYAPKLSPATETDPWPLKTAFKFTPETTGTSKLIVRVPVPASPATVSTA